MSPGSLFLHIPLSYFSQAYTAKNDPHLFIVTLLPKLSLLVPSVPMASSPYPVSLSLPCRAERRKELSEHVLSVVSNSIAPTDHPVGCLLSTPQLKSPPQAPGAAARGGGGVEHRLMPHSVSRHQSAGDRHSEALEAFIMSPHGHQVNEFGDVKQMSPPCGGKLK